MKKLSFILLASLLMYVLASYIFLSGTSDSRDSVYEKFKAAEAHRFQVINQQAANEAFAADAGSLIRIENDTEYDSFVKLMREIDNSEYMIFNLPKGSQEERDIAPGNYFLHMQLYNGQKLVEHEKNYITTQEDSRLIIWFEDNWSESHEKHMKYMRESITNSLKNLK